LLSFSSQGFGRDNAVPPPAIAQLAERDLQLEVTVNGKPTGLIAAVRQLSDGRLAIQPEQLQNCGLAPAGEAALADGWLDIAKLPGVTFDYDEGNQTLAFTAALDSLATHEIKSGETAGTGPGSLKPESGVGGLVNYTLYASTQTDGLGDPWSFSGISGAFEGRLFSPLGLLTSSQLMAFSPNDIYSGARLETAWSYDDQSSMMSYQVGDIITGGLGWNRPVRLGGVQVQRNFGLRPDLVTMPLPGMSGSAAVPSTIDVYVNNTHRLSQDVPAGPFAISDVPVLTGNGTARLVVRDALGRQTVTETPFYASSDLLASGLFDYSAELGFARRQYGTQSFSYDDRPMGSATGRLGVADWLTLEGHGEAGESFWNAGLGTTAGLGRYGIANISGTMSQGEGNGYLASASIETAFWGMQWRASSQRTFGDYVDIAAVTADDVRSTGSTGKLVRSGGPPRALDQVSLSMPLSFDPTVLNLSFTHVETVRGDRSRIVGLTASRQIGGRGNAFVTAYTDLERSNSYGIFGGLSWAFGDGSSASAGVTADSNGASVVAEVAGRRELRNGTLDWRVSDSEGSRTSRSVGATYSGATGKAAAAVQQGSDGFNLRGQLDGAVVFAGGDVFLADRVDDGVAVVDVGLPDVGVQFENRPIGKTNRRGKMLVTGLRAFEENAVSIDPETLPHGATVEAVSQKVVPRNRSGVVVGFRTSDASEAATITLRRQDGTYVEAGSVYRVEGREGSHIVGYDGQAYLIGMTGPTRLTVETRGREPCRVELDPAASKAFNQAICGDIE
jgi:outer membrane usher protein